MYFIDIPLILVYTNFRRTSGCNIYTITAQSSFKVALHFALGKEASCREGEYACESNRLDPLNVHLHTRMKSFLP